MNSFYAQMLIELQNRIKQTVPEIRWIDQDFGQLEIAAERPPVSFPCVLIDFPSTPFNQYLNDVETGDCTISIRLAFPPYSPSNSLAPESVKEKALQYYEIENKLYRALKGWYPDSEICQPLNRISDATENREDTVRVRRLTFSTSYDDYTANNLGEITEAGLQFE